MSSPDPRSVRSREAILAAARTLLGAEGPGAVTHQRVAARAGVGRATVYRHWSRADELLLAAMSGMDLPFFTDPRPPVRAWLGDQLRRLAAEMALPAVAATSLALMQGALRDTALAHRRDESVGTIAARLAAALDLAVRTGELDAALPAADATALLVGPIVYRTAMQAGEVPDALVDRLLDGLGRWGDGPAPSEGGQPCPSPA
jgi:AcrR family transcriptional regulator